MKPKKIFSSLVLTPSTNKFLRLGSTLLMCLGALLSFDAHAQGPGALYTWAGTGDVRGWVKNFGDNTVTLSNTIAGELTITETGGAGASLAMSDGPNRVRESSTGASGGLDLTGLSYLEFDIGHNGAGSINVQFYVQASPGYTYVSLGPDVPVTPGVNTYQVLLTPLFPEELIYIRTIGFNARAHGAVGDVVWTLSEVRAGGRPPLTRDLVTHDTGSAEGGLQGAIVNFERGAVLGNTAQGQSGLSHNPAGTGSLQWTDLGSSNGAAISWGNGTAWNGNSFNNRTTDLGNYDKMVVRMSAAEVSPSGASPIGVQAFFQKNGFVFQSAELGTGKLLPVDGQFHDLEYSLAGLTNMNVVEQTGVNLFNHPTDVVINVDSIRFLIVPTIRSAAQSGSDFLINFPTSAGQIYSVESSTNIISGEWNTLPDVSIEGDGLEATVTDTNALINADIRFYRLNLFQDPGAAPGLRR